MNTKKLSFHYLNILTNELMYIRNREKEFRTLLKDENQSLYYIKLDDDIVNKVDKEDDRNCYICQQTCYLSGIICK